MKYLANHIIHKQTIDICFPNFTTALSWDAASRAQIAAAIHQSIERCFENYTATKEYLTIDRLELDLGIFTVDQLQDKMPEKFSQELEKILTSYHVNLNDFVDQKIANENSFVNIWSAPFAAGSNTNPIVKNSELTAFEFFLQHGYLPWWYSNKPEWNLEWIQELTREDWQRLRNILTISLENDTLHRSALLRLISQFNDRFLASMLNGLRLKEPVENAWIWLKCFYEMLEKTDTKFLREENSFKSIAQVRQHFWKSWICYAVGKSDMPQVTAMFAMINQPLLIAHFLSSTKDNKDWMKRVPQYWKEELHSLRLSTDKTIHPFHGASEFVNNADGEKLKKADKASHTNQDDFILIPNAGLVLLHPFLQRLFEHCDWLRENKFLNDEVRNLAVNALHYLATGDEEAPEYLLMLPKLLCGIPFQQPLEYGLSLTYEQRAACDELLVQVIGHWSVLRNASPAALRETFLCRPGTLFLKDEKWRLEVQRKTEDILLDRLPWGFSMIRFKWMLGLLTVTWN